MKIRLVKDWDFFPKFDEPIGYFTGRKLLKERLINELVRRTSGAILVSGSRGVGKTALVFESLRNVGTIIKERTRNNSNWKINKITISRGKGRRFLKFSTQHSTKIVLLPIIINASQIDLNLAKKDTQDENLQMLKKEIIVILIRGLYSAVKKADDTKLELVKQLYKKALATEYRISKEIKNSKSTEYSVSGEFRLSLKGVFSLAVSTFIALGMYVAAYYLFGFIFKPSEIFKIIYSAMASLAALAVSALVSHRRIKSNTEKEIYIRDDNSVTNLEILLEEVLEKLSPYFKPVYVIDELDYFEKSTLNPKPGISIITLIKTYKNLFNLVDAVFIFIAGQGTWNTLQTGDRKDIHHTLFTSSVFLPKPEFSDVRDYIKAIAPEVKKWEGEEEKTALNYLVYKAKAEYFDLKNVINNVTTSYLQDDRLVLTLDLDGIQTRQGKVQEVVERLYNYQKYKEIEKSEENYNFLELIYKTCDTLTAADYFILIKEEDEWSIETENVIQYKTGHKWFKNLINILEWLSFIEAVDTKAINDEQGNSHTRIIYRWTGYYRRVPAKISKLETEESKDYKKEFMELSNEILLIENIYDYLLKGSKSKQKIRKQISRDVIDRISDITNLSINPLYEDQFSFFQKLSRDIPTYIDSTELVNNDTKIEEIRRSLMQDKTQLIAKVVWAAAKKKEEADEFYTVKDNLQYLDAYPQLKTLISNFNKPAYFVRKSSSGKILLITSMSVSILETLSMSTIKKLNQLRIINVTNEQVSKEAKKAFHQVVVNVPEVIVKEAFLNTKEGKDTLGKISKFMRWL